MDTQYSPSADNEVPEKFVRDVRDALAHLYDPAYLARRPLRALLHDSQPGYWNPAQKLRDLILDELETLDPEDGGATYERDRRPYLVLVHRYVDGYSTGEILDRLHVSSRQFQREHRKGLRALAMRLWARCDRREALLSETDGDEVAELRTEVDDLGVRMETTTVSLLLESIKVPAAALADRYGVDLRMPDIPDERLCSCDRTLTKQGLLAGLSSLLIQKPCLIEIEVASQHDSPTILINVSPPLPSAALASGEEDMSVCKTLFEAQGGQAVILEGTGTMVGLSLALPQASMWHVLVVDDNVKMLQLYERYLSGGRYNLSVASSATEALHLLDHTEPDVIVLDVMMRSIDGWELLQRVRSRPELEAVPVIVCSILNESELAYALGAQGYLRKPIAAEDLTAELERLLAENSRAEQCPGAP